MITVLESYVDKSDNSVWFKVALERNTDVLAKIIYTAEEIEAAKKLGVKEFLEKLKMMVDCY